MDLKEIAAIELRAMRQAWRSTDARWELTPRERRELFPDGGYDDASPPRDTETRMRIMIEVGYRIGLRDVADWLRRPDPNLGWLTPLDVMCGGLGDLRNLRAMVERGFAS